MTHTPRHVEDTRKGFAFALSGTVLISTYFVTGKYALGAFNTETFCFLWTSATTVFSLGIVIARGNLRDLVLPRRALPAVLGVCLCTGVGMVLLYDGIRRLDPSFVAFLARLFPAMVIVLGVVFLKERLRMIELAPMGVMVLGGIVSVWGRWGAVGAGVALALTGYLLFAFHRLFAKLSTAHVKASVLVFYRALGGWMVVTAWMLVLRRADFDVAPRYWWVLLVGALLGPCLGNMLSFHSYRYWSMSRNVMVLTIQPLIVLPLAWAVFRKLPEPQALVGGAVILAGSVWISWIYLQKPKTPLPAAGPVLDIPEEENLEPDRPQP
ncbi:MAG TPA: DMT family transporter [Planctomycetota bacterium]|nr:DMT family transporter [Planctomycetota bacterium]